MKKLTTLLLAVLLLLTGCGAGDNAAETTSATTPETTASAAETTAPEATEEVDYSAPDFTMLDWEGSECSLSEFEGKPMVLNFWASWCGPCKREMPEFQAVYETYGEEIHFIMLNCTASDEETDARALIEENGYTFPVYFDTTGEAAYTYGASSIPMTIFIDAEGNLVTYAVGALSAEMLETGIDMIYVPEVTE